MDPKELFVKATEQADNCIKVVSQKQLGFSTPCTEWDLKALINHMVYELLWVPDLLAGQTVSEVGDKYDGNVTGDDFQSAWKNATAAAMEAVNNADMDQTVHLSYADVPASQYISEMAMDMCIHGWDVAQSTKCNLIIDEAVAKTIYDFLLPQRDKMAAGGAFAPALDVPEDADIQTKLLALTGRRAERNDGKN